MEVDKLEELYEKLVRIPNLSDILIRQDNHTFKYHSKGGECTSVAIKTCPEISICESIMTQGCKLDIHEHEQGYEILIVLKGELFVDFLDGRTLQLEDNGYVVFEKDEPHQVTSVKNTKLIGITVPKDAGYP